MYVKRAGAKHGVKQQPFFIDTQYNQLIEIK